MSSPEHSHLRPVGPATAAGEALAADRPADGWDGITSPRTRNGGPRFLTDVIVELGLVARDRVDEAIDAARAGGTMPEEVLLQSGALTQDALARAIAERNGLDHLDLAVFRVDMGAANLISSAAAKRYDAVPVQFIGDRALRVAMADPANVLAVDHIALMTGYEVRPAVASPDGHELRVRFRIDGVLHDSATVPRRMVSGVVSRVKIMSDLDIAERRIPQ